MKALICGGRGYRNRKHVYATLDQMRRYDGITSIVHGKCHLGGLDLLAEQWADARGVPQEKYPVDHAIDGPWPGAGPRRNARMLKASQPDAVIAFPGGTGTADMIKQATKAGLPITQVPSP